MSMTWEIPLRRAPIPRLAPLTIALLVLALLGPAVLAADIQRSFDANPGGRLVLQAEGTKIEILSVAATR